MYTWTFDETRRRIIDARISISMRDNFRAGVDQYSVLMVRNTPCVVRGPSARRRI